MPEFTPKKVEDALMKFANSVTTTTVSSILDGFMTFMEKMEVLDRDKLEKYILGEYVQAARC
jgi:hypothetical protein